MNGKKRYIAVLSLVFAFTAICIGRLSWLQIVCGEENYKKSLSRTQRTISVSAPRGEIYDRYGRVIVANRMGFNIEFQRVKNMKDDEINQTIAKIHAVLRKNGDKPVSSELPITDEAPYSFTFSEGDDAAEALWKRQMELPEEATADEVIEHYRTVFNMDERYTEQEVRMLVGVRYSMLIRGFGTSTPYTLAEDVSKDTVVSVKEHYDDYRGVNITTKPVRVYSYGRLASHILGRMGLINSEEYGAFKGDGYSLNDQIGKQGIEKYLEGELRGHAGTMIVEQDENGHYITSSEAEKATSGHSVVLTIDIDVQKAAEEALRDTVQDIYLQSDRRKHGADVAGAAAVAIDVTNGEILCMASYPDYSIDTFSQEYTKLERDKNNPLFNRALSGTYSPGSTFKMLVGVAALEEDIIDTDTIIKDEVIYKLGESRYKCLSDHGDEDISGAIKDSCNFFFYTVGYNMGIETIVDYAGKFGLGQQSGIELAAEEAVGTVASPDTKASRGEPWYDGYTVQAAIGQDDNKYTPLQLVAYVAQLATGGIRYTPHLVRGVYSYDTKRVIAMTPITKAGEMTIEPAHLKAVQQGMRLVATDGTAATYFADYPIEVAAKTGTAEVYGGSDNGLFVAYAPYDDPKIAVAVVIERAGGGSYCGAVAKAIIDAYLNAENEPDATVGIDKLY